MGPYGDPLIGRVTSITYTIKIITVGISNVRVCGVMCLEL
jgi:hypothetical protein